MNYTEALAWLYATQDRGVKLGLDRVRAFLSVLGWRGAGQRFLHVAGTNGKGSVCAMLDAICRAAGYRTGLFTSPHLVTYRERIRLNGEMLEPEPIAAELSRIRTRCEEHALEPTFFEITTALALMLFQTEEAEIVVLETGLGGRLDSTNVVTPLVSVITSIGLDHMNLLGPTLGLIAREKAGIIKPNVPVVTGPLPEEARRVVREVAGSMEAPLVEVTEARRDLSVGLHGSHQQMNASIAVQALAAGGIQVSGARIAAGLAGVHWPGRFQRIGSRFVLDGAHNPAAAKMLATVWREQYGEARPFIILGILQDKDASGICAELAEIAREFRVVPVRSPRSQPPEGLVEIAARHGPARAWPSLREAIDSVPEQACPALICGSLFLVGEALTLLGCAEGEPELSAQ